MFEVLLYSVLYLGRGIYILIFFKLMVTLSNKNFYTYFTDNSYPCSNAVQIIEEN